MTPQPLLKPLVIDRPFYSISESLALIAECFVPLPPNGQMTEVVMRVDGERFTVLAEKTLRENVHGSAHLELKRMIESGEVKPRDALGQFVDYSSYSNPLILLNKVFHHLISAKDFNKLAKKRGLEVHRSKQPGSVESLTSMPVEQTPPPTIATVSASGNVEAKPVVEQPESEGGAGNAINSNSTNWGIRPPPKYFQSYGEPLNKVLESELAAGAIMPTARRVLEAWRPSPPLGYRIEKDHFWYPKANGTEQKVDLDTLQRTIKRRLIADKSENSTN